MKNLNSVQGKLTRNQDCTLCSAVLQDLMPFKRKKNLSPWRKISLVTWKTAADPSVYGQYDFDTSAAQNYLDRLNQSSTKSKITLTHFMAKCLAVTLARFPEANGIIKWGTIYQRDTVDVFLQVAIPATPNKKENLSGAKITQADQKSLPQIAEDLTSQAQQIRTGDDPQFQKTFSLSERIPVFILKPLVRLHEFLVFNLGMSIPSLGINPDPFGSLMLTSVGALDAPPGFAPLVPPSRCPLLVCLGRVEKRPWVENDQVVVKPVAQFTCTFDHRFMDGLMASRMLKALLHLLNHPEDLEKP